MSYYESEYDFSATQSIISVNNIITPSAAQNIGIEQKQEEVPKILDKGVEPVLVEKSFLEFKDDDIISQNPEKLTNKDCFQQNAKEVETSMPKEMKKVDETEQDFDKTLTPMEPECNERSIGTDLVMKSNTKTKIQSTETSAEEVPKTHFAFARQAKSDESTLLDVPPISSSSLIKYKISLGPIPNLGPELAQAERLVEADFNAFFGISDTAGPPADNTQLVSEIQNCTLNPGYISKSVNDAKGPILKDETPNSVKTEISPDFIPKSDSVRPFTKTSNIIPRPLPIPKPHSIKAPSPINPYASISSTLSHIYSPNSQRQPSNIAPNASINSNKPSVSPGRQAFSVNNILKSPLSNKFDTLNRSISSSLYSSVSSNASFVSAISPPASIFEASFEEVTITQIPEPEKAEPKTISSSNLPPPCNNNGPNILLALTPCSVCQKPLNPNERVVKTSEETILHFSCFECHICHTSLDNSRFYVHDTKDLNFPSTSPSHVENNTHNLKMGEASDEHKKQNTKLLYCYTDYHKLFSPQCHYCQMPIEESAIFALDKHWHEGHFACNCCRKPFEKGEEYCLVDSPKEPKSDVEGNLNFSVDAENSDHNTAAWCANCVAKKTSLSCWKCCKPLPQDNQYNPHQHPYHSSNSENNSSAPEPCIEALGRTWCFSCFACDKCHTPFGTSEFIFRNDGLLICFSCEGGEAQISQWR